MKGYTKKEREKIKAERLNQEIITNQGYIAKCIYYKQARDIIVEFQDKYKAKVHTSWQMFQQGKILNPYHPKRHGEIKGNKYPCMVKGVFVKEYVLWENMITRCYDEKEKLKSRNYSYQDASCCDEWLLYENFYEWLHSQPNFDRWLNGNFTLDKDILIKGNKVYSPETCCLVPECINKLFIKNFGKRGLYPIGVVYHKASDSYVAQGHNNLNKQEHLGCYSTPEKAFEAYKKHKEKIIKNMAVEEYNNGNITKECYEAMLNYVVEIDD